MGDRRLGEATLGGEPLFKGDVLRAVDPEPWLVCGRAGLVGVMTSGRRWLEEDPGVVGLGPWLGDTVDASVDAVSGTRSERELLRLRRTLTTPFVEIPRTDDDDGGSSCALPGRRSSSCDVDAPERSREPGRNREPRLVSISIDFERSKEPFGVPGSDSLGPPLLLLRVLKIEDTLLSPSGLEVSRCKLKPKRFRKEDALELTEPAVCEADLVCSPVKMPSNETPPGINSSKRLSKSSTNRSKREMCCIGSPLIVKTSAKAAVNAPRSPSLPEASSNSARRRMRDASARRFWGLMSATNFRKFSSKSRGNMVSNWFWSSFSDGGSITGPICSFHAFSMNVSNATKSVSTATSAAA
ncbi:hypothetical protein P175DRAFT_080038 [Aspergillus ochraceoroseus IBT 24754]|uniref:Uncharacterized protein n=1 Tax=Aspergillus ochraceoroseus IBT 24754 TaxID=1392256 RepID=A0A2T5MAB6_9EURO|nr:uncharacterized protein P175DRAFT_080038 [Aspergillus ochraceoroseus IBT 24754]PTU25467.1 hypothetical protein P175DRAFT_080038 [Aspergillus ochraceoroseus IBT 24754]